MFREGVLGLHGEGIAIDDEKRAGDPACLEQAFQQRGGGARLAGAGGHLDQHLAPAIGDFTTHRFDAGSLM